MEAKIPTFQHTGGDLQVKDEMLQSWRDHGVFLVKNLFSNEEVKKILNSLEGRSILKYAYARRDNSGRHFGRVLWNQPGNDLTGMVARCEKMVNTCEKLLGGEVYHYHTKLMMKQPETGGKQLWHQDYGYWYENGNLTPDMLTVFVPLDKCRKENGCLQVVPGSHHCGRIDHERQSDQAMADLDRVEHITKRFPIVYAEADPGDALFFHCNILHKSDENFSSMRRWAFLVAYNSAANNPVKAHHHPQYTPLQKVPSDAILTCTTIEDFSGKDFYNPSTDETAGFVEYKVRSF